MLSLSSVITWQLGVAETRLRALSAKYHAPSSWPLDAEDEEEDGVSAEKRTVPLRVSVWVRYRIKGRGCFGWFCCLPFLQTRNAPLGCTWVPREHEQPIRCLKLRYGNIVYHFPVLEFIEWVTMRIRRRRHLGMRAFAIYITLSFQFDVHRIV